jgi:hypothetical protein
MKLKAWKLKGGASVIIQKIPVATSDICHAFTKNIHSLNFVLYLEEEEIGVFKLSPILSFNDDGFHGIPVPCCRIPVLFQPIVVFFVNLGIVPIWDPIHYRGRSVGTSRSSPSFNKKFASLLDSEIPLSK